ncbi:AraC family transcriptional regulator [Jannaschia sp. CCS1]|uniref:AraC family transcriptional regulator n=1 Tax=Jannaschia sp. (strain CCS1) TaxID=290400 RepID=UPI00006C0097|nr:helix-turn-helix transcriptional regulator [Jannaschia sp. CCS1]ABD56014.1 transcriptional regulator, AraC family [Jannaschia sp. CCS1]
MTTSRQILSPDSQLEIGPAETADRPIVGYAKDYPTDHLALPHTHPKAQLIYAVSGVMHVDTGTSSYTLPPTTALLMPANRAHSIYMDGPVAMRALFLQQKQPSVDLSACKVVSVSALLKELILAACDEPVEWEQTGRAPHIVALALHEIAQAVNLPLGLPLPTDPRIARVTDALRMRPADSRSLQDWALFAGASERTLARLFRKETGMTFNQWRGQARLTAALSALSQGRTLAHAAAVAGYDSQPAFGAAFRRAFGQTPGEARAQHATRI